ncbi:MAG: amidohydrolase family protein, partial [Clostridia bacterium]|nr:amidohydrolase family protein [Clostridia bacterium]
AAVEKNIYAQIICDGLHIEKAAVLAAYKMFGNDRMCLISDSIRPAKLPDGEYESGGLPVFVKDNSIRLKDGTLAGSYACLMDCVKKAVEFGIPKADAVKMATETPACLLGVKKGKIAVGYDADLLIVDEFLNIQKIIIGGKVFLID